MSNAMLSLTSNDITNVRVDILGYQSWEWSRMGVAVLHIVNTRDLVMKPKAGFIITHHRTAFKIMFI